ncbi:TetR/AcrR family transcriptional regulator [Nocardia cyriacigeorgica]|uniref:TetR/AcrR family transcriptional regulator n=1 Tax=Nocardia cyriacigeorgica TaxID=135487 RepID=A0A6P1DD84_9NOCA|nr:TetR/AcrR family transcriptional regulator [Nocardia cyriacigeorgica]NEW41541.1 TetR/AcrR family transcriptional regulator [Nocardia cyriacigeorgica]NEW46760.1 TetR/AcrR family transcriptional regulator [Nocardia cyriacigeorgica]NEW52053.1 TetR/AcrR family transcriptional regulator [Nocardia cyriacigeorgica]NEW55846.1 TetR/AcrR family transcriptional regulator [Nocardia cyriacigeorgica]
MARPRGFDEDTAVDAAMRAFWSAGYEATSTQDLCTATGLGRSSIYNTFSSKHDLFERALARYMTTKNAATETVLDSDASAREKIHTLLWRTVDTPDDDPIGCLVVNSTVELGPRDTTVAAALKTDQRYRLDLLTAVIASGQRAGDIDRTKDARALALFVIATISGIQVAARGGADRDERAAIATTALDAL